MGSAICRQRYNLLLQEMCGADATAAGYVSSARTEVKPAEHVSPSRSMRGTVQKESPMQADLIEQISVLQILHGFLEDREGFIEEERQGDVGEVLPQGLLEN